MVFTEEWPTEDAKFLGSRTSVKLLLLSPLTGAWPKRSSSPPSQTLHPARPRPHLNSQHQADEVHHHLLVGQLDAGQRQQAVQRLVVLLDVRFLLAAQVDVSVELLGMLEGGTRAGTGGARRIERAIPRGWDSCVYPPPPLAQGEDAFKTDPCGSEQ